MQVMAGAGPVEVRSLPIQPRAYHEFYRTPDWQWWRPVVAITSLLAVGFTMAVVVGFLAIAIDLESGMATIQDYADGVTTPMLFLSNNLTLASLIVVAILIHRLVFRQSSGWLSSVAGRFRWALTARWILVCAPIYLAVLGVELAVSGTADLAIRPDTWFLLASVLLTTPLQAAGEEFAIRGLLGRAIGSAFAAERTGFVVQAVVTGVVFTSLHGAGDPWLNLFYFCFGVIASVLVWRTGGLEAAVALHVVNNLAGLIVVPFTGLDGLFDRDAGAGSPWILLQLAVVAGAAGLIVWQAKYLGLPTAAAPAAPAVTGPQLVAAGNGRQWR